MNPYQLVELDIEKFHDTQLLRFPALTRVPCFVHVITTRPWNMAAHQGPQRGQAIERRRLICEHLALPFDRLTAPDQIHSPHVLRVLPSDVGAGRAGRETAMKFVDGLLCDLLDVPLMQFSADCPLILAIEPERRVFGTAHASWRGTVARITTELISQLTQIFDVKSSNLLVGICPCAGPDEYEVGEDVYRIARTRLGEVDAFFSRLGGRYFFDMRAANAYQLVEAGVSPEHIYVAAPSTMKDARFFSHRREGADAGRFALIAGFKS